jgi:small nuclear ribonucleoprotein
MIESRILDHDGPERGEPLASPTQEPPVGKLIPEARAVSPMGAPPAAVMERVLQRRVTLQLKDSRILSGRLLGIDEHLNLVLDETEETTKEMTRRLGRIVLRGSNVISLNAPDGATGKSA